MATQTQANRPLNKQAAEIEAAEGELRKLAKDAYLLGYSGAESKRRAVEIITRHLRSVTIKDLADAAKRSLWVFFLSQRDKWESLGRDARVYLLCIAVLSKAYTPQEAEITPSVARDTLSTITGIPRGEIPLGASGKGALGVPLGKYHADYWRENVKPVLDRLEKETPKDPDDHRTARERRNSLRNRAEMEVRYHGHLDNIENLRASGARLVIASAHADCSERCQPWQGRVYSLDGTSGTAPDGRKFVPLEEATDVYYTTKSGKVYKNGLLGFNCRHFLREYSDGFSFVIPGEKMARKEYAITQTQREMERVVRKWRIRAEDLRGINPVQAKEARQKAEAFNREYRAFCEKNERASFPSRTKIQ